MKPIRLLATFAALLLAGFAALAQTYPDRPVRIIIPFPPGGGGDGVGRLFGEALSQRLGQSVVIDNKGGADQVIGTTAMTQAAPDGYTLMLTGSTMVVHAAYERKLPYNVFTDIVPIGKVAVVPVMLLANPKLGVKSVQELIALAKSKPGELKAGHIGSGGLHYFSFKLLEHMAGVRFLDVPYRGTAPATNAAMSGEVDLVFAGVGQGMSLAEGGKLVALAVTGAKRWPTAPRVPTMAEAGVPGYALFTEFYLYAPGGTPQPIIARLARETKSIVEDPVIRPKMQAIGFEPEAGSPESSAAEHRSRYDFYRNLIKTLNLKYSD